MAVQMDLTYTEKEIVQNKDALPILLLMNETDRQRLGLGLDDVMDKMLRWWQ